MLQTDIKKGAASVSLFVEFTAETSGAPVTGKIHSDVTASYARPRAARVAITPVTLAAVTTAFTSGGFKEIDATNQPGVYRLDVPNAAFADGAHEVVISLKCIGVKTVNLRVRLRDYAESALTLATTRTDN